MVSDVEAPRVHGSLSNVDDFQAVVRQWLKDALHTEFELATQKLRTDMSEALRCAMSESISKHLFAPLGSLEDDAEDVDEFPWAHRGHVRSYVATEELHRCNDKHRHHHRSRNTPPTENESGDVANGDVENGDTDADLAAGEKLGIVELPEGALDSGSDTDVPPLVTGDSVSNLFKTTPMHGVKCSGAWSMPMRSDSSLSDSDGMPPSCHDIAEDVLGSTRFEVVVFILILANSAVIGASTDYMARNVDKSMPLVYIVLDLFFLVMFALEIAVRIVVFRSEFCFMTGWAWNVFDLFVVVIDIGEWCAWRSWRKFDNRIDIESALPSMLILRLTRMLRMLRLLRAARFLFSLSIAQDLRTLIDSLRGCLGAFVWTCALIFTVIYIAAIYLTQLGWNYRRNHRNQGHEAGDEISAELEKWYGSLGRSVLSLFQALSGGVDWNDIVAPLIEIDPVLGFFFALYMAFAVLAVLNVVTGTFVDTALERAQSSKEIRTVSSARELFEKLDLDQKGSISVGEFQSQLTAPIMCEYLREIDVDPSEAPFLFEILDINNSGCIDCDEFLSGCVRLKGPAKALDLLAFTRETRVMFMRMVSERKLIEAHLSRIDSALGALNEKVSLQQQPLQGPSVTAPLRGSVTGRQPPLAATLLSSRSRSPAQDGETPQRKGRRQTTMTASTRSPELLNEAGANPRRTHKRSATSEVSTRPMPPQEQPQLQQQETLKQSSKERLLPGTPSLQGEEEYEELEVLRSAALSAGKSVEMLE
eukprot:TRINITY_DN12221_c0_g1_i1.p1 TRINITY_DN12221_c0_g1~~TRINITY_DN12221_c0_g1_i1.p1  ORF type:complete len:760 (+),score=126.69 TRINITY_DN12221_c0_g1_i1:42-2321(+)